MRNPGIGSVVKSRLSRYRDCGRVMVVVCCSIAAAVSLLAAESQDQVPAPRVPAKLPAEVRHVDVYLLAGQSNMDGRASKNDLKGELACLAKPQSNVWIRFRAGGLARALTLSDGFMPLEPGYSGTPGNKPNALPTATFGPELALGDTLRQANPDKKILIIKCAEGGTSLVRHWVPGEQGKLYDQFILFVNATLKELDVAGVKWTLRGMAWHQGESDVQLSSEAYQEALTKMIVRVRADLKAPELLFSIGEVFDNGKRDTVRAAQAAVAKAVPHCAFVSSKDLKMQKDGTHFNCEGQVELGRRFAKSFQGASINK